MTQYQAEDMAIFDEIYVLILDKSDVPELTSIGLVGLQAPSDERLCITASNLLDKADWSTHKALDPALMLEELDQCYLGLIQRKVYAPTQTILNNVTARQAENKEIKRTLQQDCSKSNTGGSQA